MCSELDGKQQIMRMKQQLNEYKKAEELLVKKVEFFETLSKDLNVWNWEIEINGYFTYSNLTVKSLLGYSAEEIVKLNLKQICTDEDCRTINLIEQLKLAIIENRGWKNIPNKFTHKNGTYVYTSSTAYPKFDGAKKLIGFKGIEQDITAQTIAERKLRNSKNRLKQFIANIPIGLYRTNEAGDVLLANDALVSMLKYDSLEELTNTNIIKEKRINRLARKKFKQEINENDEIIGREEVWLAKDNTEIFIRENAKIIRKDNGAIDYYEGAVEDITESKIAKEKLKKSEEQFRMIAENTKDVISLQKFNSKFTYVYLSPGFKELTGYEPDEYIGKSPFDLLHPDDKIRMFPILKEYLGKFFNNLVSLENKKIAYTTEYRMKVKSGQWRHFQAINRLVGKNVLSVSRDITERKKAEEEIKYARERLSIANSILRHDIANDLNVILSSVKLFKRNNDFQLLDGISNRIFKSLKMINVHRDQENFIDSFKELEKIELLPILKQTINNNYEIDINISGNEKVFADNAIGSVFENLFSNSVKHGHASKIDVIIQSYNEICEIKVTDNGQGISEDIKDRIFDKGFSHGQNGNTGIGLYIVKQTIHSYGGKISVEDNLPSGTIFIITLRKVIAK